ncbi:phosphatase PAP2 family protein [Pseudomonas putida]|uniref:Phosphoesterase, PA-phosphatase related n=1 Tax=Pseudomonas putida (strain W619) TaxID=390235 RepID=B1J9R3_PSEPW|nr:phosphatase PAP2 family protein [Pseudomonas putida]
MKRFSLHAVPVSRPFNFRLAVGLPILAMMAMLASNVTTIDFYFARMSYVPGFGFYGRHSYWLETVLHERVKQVVILFALVLIAGLVASLVNPKFRLWQRPLGYAVLTIGLCTSIVTPLKALTEVQCPWSLQAFGGSEPYVPLLADRVDSPKPGRCWPGGHASTGFGLLALYFALRDRHPRAGRVVLALALGLGTLLSVGRMLQGAHFLSHNVWTLLIDWLIAVLCYRWLLYRPSADGIEETPVRGGDEVHSVE